MSSVGRNPYLLHPTFLTSSELDLVKGTIDFIEQNECETTCAQVPCFHPIEPDQERELFLKQAYRNDRERLKPLKSLCSTCEKETRIYQDLYVRQLVKDALQLLVLIHNRYEKKNALFVSVKSLENLSKAFIRSQVFDCGHTFVPEDRQSKLSGTLVCNKHFKLESASFKQSNKFLVELGRMIHRVVECASKQGVEVQISEHLDRKETAKDLDALVKFQKEMKHVREDSPLWKRYIRLLCTNGMQSVDKVFPHLVNSRTLKSTCADIFLEFTKEDFIFRFYYLRGAFFFKLNESCSEFLNQTQHIAKKISEGTITNPDKIISDHPYTIAFVSISKELPVEKYTELVQVFIKNHAKVPEKLLHEVWETILQNCVNSQCKQLCTLVCSNFSIVKMSSSSFPQKHQYLLNLFKYSNAGEFDSSFIISYVNSLMSGLKDHYDLCITLNRAVIQFLIKENRPNEALGMVKKILQRFKSDSEEKERYPGKEILSHIIIDIVACARRNNLTLQNLEGCFVEQLINYPRDRRDPSFQTVVFFLEEKMQIDPNLLMKFLLNHSKKFKKDSYQRIIKLVQDSISMTILSESNSAIEKIISEYFEWAKELTGNDAAQIKQLFNFVYINANQRFQYVQNLMNSRLGIYKQAKKVAKKR